MYKLIAYQGGGYDGCHWEWNYALYKDGEYINLHSKKYYEGTRYNLDTKEEFETAYGKSFFDTFEMEEGCNMWAFDVFVYDIIENGDSIYSNSQGEVGAVHKSATIPEFYKNHAEEHLVWVGDRLSEYSIDLHHVCPMCKNDVPLSEEYWQSTSYKGDGGIGVQMLDYVCTDCYCSNTCSWCGEFIDPEGDERIWDEGCTYCKHNEEDDPEKPKEALAEIWNMFGWRENIRRWHKEFNMDFDVEEAIEEYASDSRFYDREDWVDFWMNRSVEYNPNQLSLEL